MITPITDRSKMVGADGASVSFVGLSSDDKPESAPNGAAFIEMDTGNVYFFDAENSEWRAL